MNGISRVPYVEIVYEPSPVYRMRYEAENRSTYLVAENFVPDRENTSSAKNRKKQQVSEGQYPRVKVVDGEGPATLIVSCVNKTEPYHVHPHKLVGPNCKHGVAVFNIDKKQNIFDLIGVSIQFTKKSDIENRIKELKEKNVDPFNVGFDFDRQSIDLTSVRLCFQIYLRDSFDTTEIIRDKYHILKPVVSQVISNSSRKITLSIISAFNLNSSCNGGSDVVIFIKKLEKDQKPLKAKFYDSSGWSSIVDIEDSKIHYQCAISFKAPQYPKKIDKEETVFFKLFIPPKTGEEKDNEEEDSLDLNSQASPSSHSSSPESKQLGQYESREIEFVYRPIVVYEPLNNFNRKKMTDDFFCFSDLSDKEAVSQISSDSRKRLRNRQMMNIKNHHPDSLNVPFEIIYNDPVLANNVMMDEKLVLNSSDLSNGHNNEIKDLEINGLASENENVERYQLKNLIDNMTT
ncbi:embryonic polarity dorsal-like isoform X1 [Brachionus plicatilis]|uniref:Embryonic polarity dorsal-like isoform X1 n=1 Tax=Brachionus plicatilis TaxID=10195 RepID=A0A3M7RQV0_BRAPC|nr:embryonic polarity dorsal-like isoform X1 [Brachionus plicatilis]